MNLASLMSAYTADPDSSYHKQRYHTRETTRCLLRAIERDCPGANIAEINARQMLRWHEGWVANRGLSMAHSLVGMLRTLCTFGATLLECPECRALKTTLSDMRFEMAKPRKERLTAEQASAIREKAHEMGIPSMALAQAFQFECTARQRDIIGEWVPQSEPGITDVYSDDGWKWFRGIRWEEIDANMILVHVTSKRGKPIQVNLRLAPMVMDELALFFSRPTHGPIIVSEHTGVPWTAAEFRRKWREVARAAGVPDHVWNMHTRHGAITEGFDSGAEPSHIQVAATHSDLGMTQHYNRGDGLKKVEGVQRARVAYRSSAA